MKLRDHPLMLYHGVTNWPPMWTQGVEKNKTIVRDEVGILRYVNDVSPTSKKIYLVIEYEREHYVGTLFFDDIAFRHQITNVLQQNIGRPIEEIGDLDLSYTPLKRQSHEREITNQRNSRHDCQDAKDHSRLQGQTRAFAKTLSLYRSEASGVPL